MPQTKPIISIENVVSSATVDQKMDLNNITKKFHNTYSLSNGKHSKTIKLEVMLVDFGIDRSKYQ